MLELLKKIVEKEPFSEIDNALINKEIGSSFEDRAHSYFTKLLRFKEVKLYLQTLDFPEDAELNERLYSIVYGIKRPICSNNREQKYQRQHKRFGFCGTNTCPCFSADRLEKYNQKVAVRTSEYTAKIVKKRQETTQRLYGCKSPQQNPDIRKKTEETNLVRYGGKTPANAKNVRDKMIATTNERFGVDNVMQNPEIKQKAIETCLERYGHINPSRISEIKLKKIETSQKNYGVDYPMQNDTVREVYKSTLLDRYGVDNSHKIPSAITKYTKTSIEKYGVPNPTQQHYSPETFAILSNTTIFSDFVSDKSNNTAANDMKINISTIKAYKRLHEVPHNLGINSTYEREIATFLAANDIIYEERNRTLIKPLEIDFYLPEYNAAIEFNGLYWHSDKKKDNNYHYNKWKACNNVGIRLLMINEDEWNNHSASIKRKILNICGKSERGVGARKLKIRAISIKEGQTFCDTYHIQGKTATVKYAYGAYNGDALVAIMLFNQQRNTQKLELIRFCTDGKTYAGLFSKIFSAFINEHFEVNEVLSFADLRYSDGNLYRQCGFKEISIIKPDYRYLKNGRTYHKTSLQKKQIAKKFDLVWETEVKPRSERELTEELGFSRIYDCGKIKFVWKRVIN